MASKTPPWLKFDLEVWCEDHHLMACPLDTQGFFLRLMRWLAHATSYGHLWMNDHEPTPSELSNTIPLTPKTIAKHLSILKTNHVLKCDSGVWYSKRMVEDWLEYQEFVKHGKKGGRPSKETPTETPPYNPNDNHNGRTDVRTYGDNGGEGNPDLTDIFDEWQEDGQIMSPATMSSLRKLLVDLDRRYAEEEIPVPPLMPPSALIVRFINEIRGRGTVDLSVPYLRKAVFSAVDEALEELNG